MAANPLIQESLVEIRLGKYGVAQATALTDSLLLPNVRNYKRQVASRMLPLAKDDIGRKIPDAEYYVSRKIDGEFSVLAYKDGHALIVNPGGTVRVGLPWLEEAVRLLDLAECREALIAGELYVDHKAGRRPRVHDVVSVVRQPRSDEELARIKFAVFDILSINGEMLEQPYEQTWQKIESLFGAGSSIHPVETLRLKGHRDVEQQFQKWVEVENAEGLVVRSETAGNFKIKPRHNLDAVVIGFTESTEDRQGMLHDLLVGVARTDGSIQVLCRVGGGFSDDNRRELLSDLQDLVVESEYAEVNSDHVAYQMVKPKWVIEISCLDMIGQNTRGGPVNRMVLNWNAAESRYEVIRRLPLVSVISPQLIRIRDDKRFDVTDVRISQVTDLLPIELADVDAREMQMANSVLMEREVYTKQLRGEMLVRKFLMWKTNKENETAEFPAYVASYTDFSPSRKSPLDRDVRVSDSETQIRALYRQFKEDNIKKGWELHSASSDRQIDEAKSAAEPPDAAVVTAEPESADLSGGNERPDRARPTEAKPAKGKIVKTRSAKENAASGKSTKKSPAAKKTAKQTAREKAVTKKAAVKKSPKSTTKKSANQKSVTKNQKANKNPNKK